MHLHMKSVWRTVCASCFILSVTGLAGPEACHAQQEQRAESGYADMNWARKLEGQSGSELAENKQFHVALQSGAVPLVVFAIHAKESSISCATKWGASIGIKCDKSFLTSSFPAGRQRASSGSVGDPSKSP